MDEERLPKQAYLREEKEINTENSWGRKIKDLLERNGFGYVWMNKGVVFKRSFLKSFRLRLTDQFWQEWNAKLNEKERYVKYREFKTNHDRELYLKVINITKFRKIFTKLRLGILDIKANKVYYDETANVNCPLCNKHTENETHLLFQCPSYDYLRNKFIEKHWPDMKKVSLADILNTNDEDKIKDLAMYIYYAMKRREYLISSQ